MSGPRVAVIGVGGLGAPAALALAEAGVRRFTLIDPDHVERSNLHRQLLYREADVGAPKVIVLGDRLRALFPELAIEAHREPFVPGEGDRLRGHDLVIDGTDQFETKLALGDVCCDLGLRYVFGGVVGYEGQVLGVLPGRSACLRCLFEEAPPPGAAPTCSELGILGPVAGIAAARQAEVGRSLLGDHPAVDRLWTYDGRLDRERWIPLARQADCRGCGPRRSERGRREGRAPVAVGAEPTLDLRGEVCPATFQKTRRALEALPPEGRLWVQLDPGEPSRSVPASVRAAGHRVLAEVREGAAQRFLFERCADVRGAAKEHRE